MNVHQFATALSYGDAISDEMLEIREVLREKGFDSEIFVHFYDPRSARHVRDYREYRRYSAPDNVILFHFSIGSPVTKMAFRVPDRKIMIYHNITPHEYFLDTHRILARECYKGRLELALFTDKVELALGDSEFNRLELEAAGYKATGVLPILMNFAKFDGRPDPIVRGLVGDGKTNVLFVGRCIPNKKIENVLKVFACYKRYFNPDARLVLAGEYRGLERYLAGLEDLALRLRLTDVHFAGHTDFAELLAYYETAAVYLSMSEHEGFGVPLLEAFYKNIPVAALPAGAVEETMNGGGVLVRDKDFPAVAAVIDRLVRDGAFRAAVLAGQKKALQKYGRENVSRILLQHIERAART